MATKHENKTMQQEIERVQIYLRAALAEIELDGGSVRFFNAAFMSAAVSLHAQIEGRETIDAALSKNAARYLACNTD